MHHVEISPFDFIVRQIPKSPFPLNPILQQELIQYWQEVQLKYEL